MSSQRPSSMLGLYTRAASISLLFIISTAIATTKIPELHRVQQGFWYMVSTARTDFCYALFAHISDMDWRRKLVY
jgi:tryptophan synthase alpha subunit